MPEPGPDLTSQEFGSAAEDAAAHHLLEKGWTIVKRRYKARHGEIDILALDGDLLVAVEVKGRQGAYLPEEAVDLDKQAHLRAAAQEYLEAMGIPDRLVRFDVIAVHRGRIRHLVDAFR